ncbi:MAG: O-antigen ligase family protein [Candidatus Omnitrophota bacterium]
MSGQKLIRICDKVIEFSFYALLVAVTFSTSIVEIAASLMILAWAVRMAVVRDLKSLKAAPVLVLGAFFAWTLLSCLNSEYFKESFRGVFKIAEYSLVFIIVATSFWEDRKVKRAIFAVTAITVIVCVSGIFQYFTGFDFIRHRLLIHQDYMRRISSSFVHPNDFGGYLLLVSIMFISFILSGERKLTKRLAIFLPPLVLSLGSLFLTKSRGAWISFSAAFLVLGALRSKKMVAVFLAILLVVFIMLPYTAQQRIFALVDLKGGTTWERVMLWKGTINMIKEHPVLGFGTNTYSRNFPKYKPADYPDYRYTHNSYLHMASEVGIVGAFLFLVFLVMVFVHSLSGIHALPGGMRKALSLGLFAGLVGFSLNCMVDTHLYSVNLAVLFYLLLGFCFSLSTRS